MKPFNVTLIQPDGYVHALALAEAAHYVHACLLRAGYASTLTSNAINPNAHNVIFCAHLLSEENFKHLPADTIIFNSEQLKNKDGWYFQGPYGRLLENFYVWDYSLRNLPEIAHSRKFHIPFLFCADLARAPATRQHNGTLCFYGSRSARRERLMDELRAAGVPTEAFFGKYGAERDAIAFTSWAVLNISTGDGLWTFEPIRCFDPLTNGIPVISEISARDPTFEIYRDWLFAFDASDMVRGVAALYGDQAAFSRAADEKLAHFRQTSGPEAVADAVAHYRKEFNL